MDFNEYQKESRKTVLYTEDNANCGSPLVYVALGIAGESGEVIEKIKKLMRNQKGIITDDFRRDIQKELGDVLWYIAQMATELNLNFNDIAKANLEKLTSRLERGVLHAQGDDR